MWEARGDAQGLIAWWRVRVLPILPAGVEVELFRSADRLVALVRCGDEVPPLPDPPAELVSRPPHVWPFDPVR
jgi:hypothetical protein